jgi:hypothetical protein
MEDMFVLASRMKLRFPYKGIVSVEDLWDLPVQELDRIFKALNAKLKTEKEDSLLGPKEKSATDLELQVAIIRYIVGVKLNEMAIRKAEVERAGKKQKILAIMSEKQDMDLKAKSLDELTKMLEDL